MISCSFAVPDNANSNKYVKRFFFSFQFLLKFAYEPYCFLGQIKLAYGDKKRETIPEIK